MFITVDFPAPFGPIKPYNLPSSMSMDTPSTTRTAWNECDSERAERMGRPTASAGSALTSARQPLLIRRRHRGGDARPGCPAAEGPPRIPERPASLRHETARAEPHEGNDQHSDAVSYTHLRAHETGRNLVCRL